MKRIKFAGFQPDATVTMSVAQGSLVRGPVTVSAWKASHHEAEAGAFRVRTSIVDENWADVSEGDVIETVAPGRVRVWVDQFSGWAGNDPRNIWVDVDYGERYDFRHTDHADLPAPSVLRRLAGTQAGYYPGVLSGHSMRGTDMQGNQVLTATHDQGGDAPIGTLDRPVTVTVTDGLATETLTFIVRLIDPFVYYTDRLKTTYAPSAPEAGRRGLVYVSADGDFTGAPAKRTATAIQGGVYHQIAPNGEFDQLTFRQGKLPWGQFGDTFMILFKAGERFYPVGSSFSPDWAGTNGIVTTWYHDDVGGDQNAIIDYERLAQFNPASTRDLIQSNNNTYTGSRLVNLTLHVSDYDVSDITWREWWNVIRYENKTGTLIENTSNNMDPGKPLRKTQSGFNGETLANGNGVYTQLISDDGVGTLICRQVVNTENTDQAEAKQAFFADGDTLTGLNSGATMTFVAAGSRQDRTRKCPGRAISMANMGGVLLDNVIMRGASNGISGLGRGAVIADCLFDRYWNYGAQQTGGVRASWSEAGNVTVQPLAYEGTPRDFGGATVSGNRNYFNAMIDGTDLATNDVSHAGRRFAEIEEYSAHYCFLSTYGGHGGSHQPQHRMGTGGSDEEGLMTVQIYGSGFNGGGNQMHFSTIGAPVPRTPAVIRLERCHLRGSHATRQNNFYSVYTNYVLRNSVLDRPAGTGAWDPWNIEWISSSDATYKAEPDLNAVEPIVEFNTMTAFLDTSPASTVDGPFTAVRNTAITYRNNAFVLDQAVLGAIDAEMLAAADDPAHYDTNLRPLALAQTYQSATGPLVPAVSKDALDSVRAVNPSQGALEPS